MDKKKEKYIRKKAEPDEVESDLVSFDLVDAKTVKRRIEEGDVKTPFMRTKKYLDIPKDQRWNTKALNSKLLAGILNGDSIPKIATSLQDVIGNNSAAATRNARTIITGAENAGRKDSYEDLEEQGVIQKKVWIATPDDRTRESHLLMDGEEVDIDEPFSNGLMYPGDPSGDASEVYNCRCTMRTHIIGFKKADGRVEKVGQRDDIGHEAAIAKEQAEREAEAEAKLREKEAREAENEAKRKAEEERREEIDRQEEKGKSFVESLANPDYSPNISQFKSYEDYAAAKAKWRAEHEGEPLTRYIEDLNWENKGLHTQTAWGKADDKIPRLEATIVKMNDQYPLPKTDKEYGTKADTLIVCDYNQAWQFLPDGDNDRRLTDEAAAQVFQNGNQIVIAFNRETMVSTIEEDIATREKAIKNGEILSSVGYSPEVTAIHEYGHALEDHIGNAMIYQDETAMDYWNWYKSLTKDEIRQGLSDYATTNRSEFEAECLAELQMPNPRPLALKFKEYLDEAIKKGY